MKKILVLAVIVGLASLASAGVQLIVNGADVVTGSETTASAPVVIDADLATSEVQYTVLIETTGDLTIDSDSTAFGTGWMFGNTWTGGKPADGATSAILSGGDFNAKPVGHGCFTGLTIVGTLGEIIITETLSDLSTVVTTVLVPEPMTMALLGHGGLFLRRRK